MYLTLLFHPTRVNRLCERLKENLLNHLIRHWYLETIRGLKAQIIALK